MGGPVPNTAIGPGLGAFLTFFALAVALFFILRNMNARMRRMAYRERDRLAALDAADAAKAAKAAGGGAGADGDVGESGAVADEEKPPTQRVDPPS